MHVQSDGVTGQLQQLLGLGGALEETLVEQARRELENLAAELAARHGVAVQPALVQGAVLDGITREAAQMNADLVVLGARGAGFLRRFVLGSTAERLLRKSTHPMLVVKQQAHEPYRRVLVAADFSPWSTPLIGLAQRTAPGAGLAPADWTPCIAHADASLAIVEQEQACDLIVISKHVRSMLEELLLGSVTTHVLAESAGDVLVSTATRA